VRISMWLCVVSCMQWCAVRALELRCVKVTRNCVHVCERVCMLLRVRGLWPAFVCGRPLGVRLPRGSVPEVVWVQAQLCDPRCAWVLAYVCVRVSQ